MSNSSLTPSLKIHFVKLIVIVEEVDENEEDEGRMQCDIDAQSEVVSEDEDANETDTMTVTSEAPIPADKYDQETNITEEQEILNKIKGKLKHNLWFSLLLEKTVIFHSTILSKNLRMIK